MRIMSQKRERLPLKKLAFLAMCVSPVLMYIVFLSNMKLPFQFRKNPHSMYVSNYNKNYQNGFNYHLHEMHILLNGNETSRESLTKDLNINHFQREIDVLAQIKTKHHEDSTEKRLQKNIPEKTQLVAANEDMKQSPAVIVDHNNMTTRIAFLKVHKAGSTTMQNIMFRFGLKHNLNILLPRHGNFLYNKNQILPLSKGEHYDIFAIHTVYSEKLFSSILPADSVKIGIVREPVERMISAAYYYRDVWRNKNLRRVPRANFIHNLVQHPERYERHLYSKTRNAMALDFGFPANIKSTEVERIQHYLDELNTKFSLVLTVERFDESLVLMKRLLHWPISDILYTKANKHKHTPVLLRKDEYSKFKKTSFLDFAVYEYFKKVLDNKLAQQSDDFWKEVKYFKGLLTKVKDYCSSQKRHEINLKIDGSVWNDAFSLSHYACKKMIMSELKFISVLHKKTQ